MTRAANAREGGLGFTLLEVALTLFIVTLLLGSVLVPLQTQVENRKIEETQRLLEQAREALLGYAVAYGYLPCPATATSGGNEPPSPGTDHGTGACVTFNGFLPGALLGFPNVDGQGYAIDAWGGAAANRIRYAVSNHDVSGVPRAFTTAGGMASASIPSIASNTNLLHVCGSGVGVVSATGCGATAQTLASNVVAVVWSLGANVQSGGGASVHEVENLGADVPPSTDRVFVSRVRTSGGANEFDDQLVWISTYGLISRMVASGQLP